MSNRARALDEARQAALAVPEIREDRVHEVKRRLDQGLLAPDLDRIARALIGQGVLG